MQSRERTGAALFPTEFGVRTTGTAMILLISMVPNQGRRLPRLAKTDANLKAGCEPQECALDFRWYQRTWT
eukprot:6181601-Pleurochrysis_carterae.AAC.1